MLADGVEAATRVLSEPTAHRVREVIEHIVKQRLEQGQLREAPLNAPTAGDREGGVRAYPERDVSPPHRVSDGQWGRRLGVRSHDQ